MELKCIVITPENDISVQIFEKPVWRTLGAAVGGFFEIVHPLGLQSPYCMLVDECGYLKENPKINLIGSALYESAQNGHPIFGTIVILKEVETDEGGDLAGLDDSELEQLMGRFQKIASTLPKNA